MAETEDGQILNVNTDVAVAELARALESSSTLFRMRRILRRRREEVARQIRNG
jgi:acetylglutamate kinase